MGNNFIGTLHVFIITFFLLFLIGCGYKTEPVYTPKTAQAGHHT